MRGQGGYVSAASTKLGRRATADHTPFSILTSKENKEIIIKKRVLAVWSHVIALFKSNVFIIVQIFYRRNVFIHKKRENKTDFIPPPNPP